MKCAETEVNIPTKNPVFVASQHGGELIFVLSSTAIGRVPATVRRRVQYIGPEGINVYEGARTPVKRGNRHPVNQGRFFFSVRFSDVEKYLPRTIGKFRLLEAKQPHAA